MEKHFETWEEWFDSLSQKEQEDYIADMYVDYWVDYYKENPND